MKLQVTKYLAIELTEPNELIELIDEDDKVEFMQSLSCHDVAIKHVADQIIHGCTSGGHSGSEGVISESPSTPLQKAKREIALSSSDIASREIRNLERALGSQKERFNELENKYYELLEKVGN